MRYYLHKQKSILYSFWQNQFFNTWVNISFNFRARKSYYIPNYCKLYEESAELDHFALATLDPELQPRKPVHFFMSQTLCSNELLLSSFVGGTSNIKFSLNGQFSNIQSFPSLNLELLHSVLEIRGSLIKLFATQFFIQKM